jgi:hypothetical protein
MKTKKKISLCSLLIAFLAMAALPLASSCNRAFTYEDGMFDYNEIYSNDDATNDTFQINSEIDNDDTERY